MFYDRLLGHLFVFALTVCGICLMQVQVREEIECASLELATLAAENPGVVLQLAGAGLVLAGVGARFCQLATRERESLEPQPGA